MQDPQQELFTALKLKLEQNRNGYAVYDSDLPPEGTAYPFIYLGDSQLIDDISNKTCVVGHIYQTIHVWHSSSRKRGELSSLLLEMKQLCRQLEHTDSFSFMVSSINQQILPDNTTSKPLLHGIIELEYSFD